MRHNRAPLSLFILFLALGAVAGLAWAWLIAPIQAGNTTPANLNNQDREIYLQLVADNLAGDGDTAMAARRVAELGPAGKEQLAGLVVSALDSGRPPDEGSRLAALAFTLGVNTPAVSMLAQPQPLPAATAAHPIPASETTSEPDTGNDRFRLLDRRPICTPGESAGRIEIVTLDTQGEPLAGVNASVQWESGHDTFITGFDTGKGVGFGDFEMEPGIVYSINLDGDKPSATDIQIQPCADGQEGGWQLEYREQNP